MIPIEIHDFFKERGRILVVKGSAGTGKTLFGIQLLKEVDKTGEGIWVNSRDLDFSERRELEAIKPKRKRVDARRSKRGRPKVDANVIDEKVPRQSKDKSIIIELFQEISKARHPPVVVIDSLEGLMPGMSVQQVEDLKEGFVNIARSTGASIAIIMETYEKNQMDYLCDGVVTLREEIIEDRRARFIHLEKLRGTLIKRPSYLFTLHDGNFRYFPPTDITITTKPFDLKVIEDKENIISTGIADFDALQGGGFQKGGAYLIEVDSEVPNYLHLANLILPTVVNHLNLGRGIIYLPPGLRNIETLLGMLSMYVDMKKLDRNIASMSLIKEGSGFKSPICEAKGKDLAKDFEPLIKVREKYQELGPVMTFFIADTLEYIYGPDEAQATIVEMITDARANNNIVYMVVRDTMQIAGRLHHVASSHWMLKSIKDSIVIYGILPRTEMYFISTMDDEGPHVPRLHSIV